MEEKDSKSTHTPHFSIPAKTLGLIILLAIVASALVYAALLPQKPAQNTTVLKNVEESETVEDTTLSIEPAENNSIRNRVYDVNVNTGKNKVTAVQIELVFDPNVLRNVEISPSEFFPNYLVLLNSIDEKNGRISFALTLPPKENGVLGIGSIAQIKFNISSQSAFPTFIEFMPKTEVSAENISVSVLKETIDAVVDYQVISVSPIP